MRLLNSVISGVFAALAGVCGKLAFDQNLDLVPSRLAALSGLVACNATMLHFFVKALRVDGSVVGTTVNAAANIATSAAAGFVLLGEKDGLTPTWFMGALCALLGVLFLSKGTVPSQEPHLDRKRE